MMLETTQLLANTYKSAIDRLINHLDQRFDSAVDMMLQSTGQVIVCGMGKSGLFGQKISSTLASTGTPSIFCIQPRRFMVIWGGCGQMMCYC
jgi:arabinose-5-phosphate isomerase